MAFSTKGPCWAACFGLTLLLPAELLAFPSSITYTAYLQDADGAPVTTALPEVEATLLDAESGGAVISAQLGAVSLSDGLLQLTLEDVDASALAAGAWISVTIDGETFDPPQRIVAVPYALRAANVALPAQGEPPAASSSGELWYDTATARLMVHDGSQWVPVVSAYTQVEANNTFAPKSLAASVSQNTASVASAAATLADHTPRLDTVESSISAIDSVLDSLMSTDSTYGTRIAALETHAEATDAELVLQQESLACARTCGAIETQTCLVHTCDQAGACVATSTQLPDGAACVTRYGAGACTAGSCRWAGNGAPGTYGLGISYANGRFSIVCEGQPCGPGNPGYVVLPSDDLAGTVTLRVASSDHHFDDASAPGGTPNTIGGNAFGTEPGVSWPSSDARPFFLYAVNGSGTDAGLAFALSPNPAADRVPDAAYIATRNDPAATQRDTTFFFMSGPEAKDYANTRRVQLVGRIRMYKEPAKGVADNWWVAPLTTRDGLGAQNTALSLTFPPGQSNAAAGTYFIPASSADTVPLMSSMAYYYSIGTDGYCDVFISIGGTVTKAGAGSGNVSVSLPYRVAESSADHGGGRLAFADNYRSFVFKPYAGSAFAVPFIAVTISTDRYVKYEDFVAGETVLKGHLRYKAF
ncbi:MAG: hypothetical protein R3F39_20175 [Myxococcota bacterium]